MARPTKQGLDYFPLDVNFIQDIRMRKLVKYQGGRAVTVYALLLCIIYKDGYYIRRDKELPFIISEQSGFDEAYIGEVINCCLNIGLLSKEMYEKHGVLTSRGIQLRWAKWTQFVGEEFLDSDYNMIRGVKIPRYKLSPNTRLYNRNVKKWYEIMKTVFKRDDYTCRYCGKKGGILEVDHIVPFSKGGSDDLSNLATSCRHCNRQKRDKSVEEFLIWRKRNNE